MAIVSMKALLESGVHFGHRTNKWNPAMKPYIFTERNGIHIIDLQQTVKALGTAYTVVRDLVAGGGVILFVGTKRQAQETVREEAERCGMPYATERWMGGILTNWFTINQRIQELERLEKLFQTGEIERLTKKEGLVIQRRINRLDTRLSGIRNMKRPPDGLFVVDIGREATAVHEANLLGIPVVGLVDTNCDPASIDYVIPSNDDAIRAIKLLVGKIADAVLEGKAIRKEDDAMVEEEMKRAEAAPARKAVHIVDEEELEDEDLLGEATLAKLAPGPKDEEKEDESNADNNKPEPDDKASADDKLKADSGDEAEDESNDDNNEPEPDDKANADDKPKSDPGDEAEDGSNDDNNETVPDDNERDDGKPESESGDEI
ncbi:MAG: 30S ribosomal protein S2 [Chloroflexota bacterium]